MPPCAPNSEASCPKPLHSPTNSEASISQSSSASSYATAQSGPVNGQFGIRLGAKVRAKLHLGMSREQPIEIDIDSDSEKPDDHAVRISDSEKPEDRFVKMSNSEQPDDMSIKMSESENPDGNSVKKSESEESDEKPVNMSGPRTVQYYNYPGVGIRNRHYLHYSQACRVGNNIECSGQGGWDPTNGVVALTLDEQVDQAFANVDLALKHVGGHGWSHVYKVRSYHAKMNDSHFAAMLRNLKKWCPNHAPLWIALGIDQLAEEKMKVEIEVEAYEPFNVDGA